MIYTACRILAGHREGSLRNAAVVLVVSIVRSCATVVVRLSPAAGLVRPVCCLPVVGGFVSPKFVFSLKKKVILPPTSLLFYYCKCT